MSEVRYVVCAEPIDDHVPELLRLGVAPGNSPIRFGTLASTSDMEWVGIEPLPVGQAFNLRTWDEPREREPGWHSFHRCAWVANALNLVVFRVPLND